MLDQEVQKLPIVNERKLLNRQDIDDIPEQKCRAVVPDAFAEITTWYDFISWCVLSNEFCEDIEYEHELKDIGDKEGGVAVRIINPKRSNKSI